MKQIIQKLNSKIGVEIIDFPAPLNKQGHVLIKTTRTLVSKGTEKMLVEFGNANYLQKARQKPDRVKVLFSRLKSDGIIKTINTVRNSMQQYIALGYCNCGVVIESDVNGIKKGDRVISNGPHAEIVRVPANLVAKIPNEVSDDEAVFTVIGSIGLQGMRLCNPTYGETIVVFGLGLVGLITIQLLKANGVNVIGIDIDDNKCKIANNIGIRTLNPEIEDIEEIIYESTSGNGADGVIITAASKSNEIISKSAEVCRKKGRIILVGVVGLDINRDQFYNKELVFQVSCSYGPGRYDKAYEEDGNDYPLPFVRWTEKRNFETILNSIKNGNLKLSKLITEKVELPSYKNIYDNIDSNKSIASLIVYPDNDVEELKSTVLKINSNTYQSGIPVIGIIGSGNFTKSVVIPCLENANTSIKCIASSQGMSSSLLAKKYGLDYCTTDYNKIIEDKDVNTVIITTRHDTHAKIVIDSLAKEKNIFVEKPLALNEQELANIENAFIKSKNYSLMVGYNRRFSCHAKVIKKQIKNRTEPINIIANMNAGFVSSDNWVNQEDKGGGRIIGEACHLIDLAIFFTNSLVSQVCMNSIDDNNIKGLNDGSILLRFENGSNAVINYFTNGSKDYPKERVEIYSNNKTYIIDNYENTYGFGDKYFKSIINKNDKGHQTQFIEYIESIKKGSPNLIETSQIFNSAKASISCIKSLKENTWVKL